MALRTRRCTIGWRSKATWCWLTTSAVSGTGCSKVRISTTSIRRGRVWDAWSTTCSAAVDFLVDGKGKARAQMPPLTAADLRARLLAGRHGRAVRGGAGPSHCGRRLVLRIHAVADGHQRQADRRQPAPVPVARPATKLGLFAGRRRPIPCDFDDVLPLIAPRLA